jgi:putative exosortase-associated protein (TIGR04073 family)
MTLCLIFTFIGTNYSFADHEPLVKLRRGITNVLTSPVEIPKQVRAAWIAGSAKTFHISAWLFYGFVKGLWMMPVRVASGLWDIVTFPNNSASLVQPAYVFDEWPHREKGVVYHNLGN